MKVALLFNGLVRTLEQTWPIMREAFGRYEPDIYYYLNEPEKEPLIQSLLKPKLVLAEPDIPQPEYDYKTRYGPGGNSVQNDLRQFYSLMRVNQLRRSTGIAYDWVIRIRPDLLISKAPEPLETLEPSFIYIPKFCNWFGYSDRFAVGPPQLMDIYMERYPAFADYFARGGPFQMESFLAYHLRHNRVQIARSGIVYETLRLSGKRDPVYWNGYWGDVE